MADAKAALVIVDLDKEKCISVDVFTDDGTGLDPRMKAELLWKSVEKDWPTCQPAYVDNDESAELAKQRKLFMLGMLDDGEPMKARIEEHNKRMDERKAAHGR